MKIRAYCEDDYEEISSWWKSYGHPIPLRGMMIEDGTFVVEKEEKPAMTLTVYKTQSKQVSYLEGYCVRPDISKKESNEMGNLLWEHCFDYLRRQGFKRVSGFTFYYPSLIRRYREFGMKVQTMNLVSMGREL
jgi:hypothetical protein